MKKNNLFIVLFTLIVLSLCTPIGESDFFWHLATGNWILNTGELPSIDSFTYTAPLPDSRDLLILKGYWLSQVTYASLWRVFGAGGIVALRAIILCGLFYSVYEALKRRGLSPWLGLLAILPVFIDMRLPGSIGDRPQLWSFLLASVFVLILDDFSKNDSVKKCLLLSMLTVLWANLHPGVLLGCMLVSIYLCCDFGRNMTGKRNWSCLLLVPVLLSTLLNPVGYKIFSPIMEILRPSREMQIYLTSNLDGTNLLELWRLGEFRSWGFVFVLLVCMVTIVFKIKKIRAEHLVVIVVLAVMAFSSSRYMIFLTILGLQVSLPYWNDALIKFRAHLQVRNIVPIFVSFMVVISSFAMFKERGSVFFDNALNEYVYPKGAVNFLKTAHPPGNLFNVYEWGGYLMVFLPEYKVYIDGRGLGANTGSMIEYKLIRSGINPFWKSILEQRQIDVVMSVKEDVNGFTNLNEALLLDPDWTLVYQDDLSLVFVRKNS